MSEKKLDIRELMEQNNIQIPNKKVETRPEEIVGRMPEGFDRSQVENACEGIEVEREEIRKTSPVVGGGVTGNIISTEQMSAIEETLAEIDREADAARKEFEEWNHKQAAEQKLNDAKTLDDSDDDDILEDTEDDVVDTDIDPREFKKKYEEAVVVIDKSKMGQVVEFTDAERAKLEKVKKITLEEVETVELKSLKTKKVKKGTANKILQKINNIRTTNIVLPITGITVVMKGCSTFELMGLVSNDDNSVMGLISKWTLIHSKIESTSIGHLEFNKFLNSVAQMEYDIFVYGILCATFPDEDVFPLICPKCKTEIEHKYIVRTLLRAEEMSERLQGLVKYTIDSSYTEETAKECYESSLLNTSELIKLPESEMVFSIGFQTAYSFIYDSVDAIDKMEAKYSQAIVLASAVDTIFVPDPESDGEYYEIDSTVDKVAMIYSLGSKDIGILGAKISKTVEGIQFTFGLMDVNCEKSKCGNHVNTVPVDMDTILFHKHQQAMNTTID